ncbi:putative RNA-directed DNA polymerase from transposon X-element [Trichonephila clavipes]|nr:putative RNA-directed DNA polymerase from transposon X-element [Trichonephila clavipes]
MSDDRRAASPCWAPWWVEAYWNEHKNTLMEPSSNSPSLEHRNVQFSDSFRFFILKTPATFTNVSPFLIEKAITGAIGEVKSIRKMRSGDLFLEVSSSNQATALIKLQKLAHLELTVAPHSNLNFSRGVISPADFLNVSTEEIKENMKAQKVCDVRRITIRRDGQVLNTKHLILTFSTPDLPQTVKMAYIRCPVRPYIPNPLRCFQCQRYGHSKNVCRGQPTCPRCGESGHDSADCKKKEQCLNCKGEHPAYSRSCPTWITEKEITAVKIKEKISYPEARRVVLARTPVSGKSYASATRKSTSDKCIQCDSKKISARIHPHLLNRRDFHRKIEDDTLTGDCSEDDEDLMDIQSGPSTSSSRGGASAAQ